MTPQRITTIVLALNEADNLRSLLPQLRWADETLVVDGGSTDESVPRLSGQVTGRVARDALFHKHGLDALSS